MYIIIYNVNIDLKYLYLIVYQQGTKFTVIFYMIFLNCIFAKKIKSISISFLKVKLP